MTTIVTKFGGSSLAGSAEILQAVAFVKANANRRYVVVSAPGRRRTHPEDIKVTDILRACITDEGGSVEQLERVVARFEAIRDSLGLSTDLKPVYQNMRFACGAPQGDDFLESCGEYLMGRLMADALGFPFVNASEIIRFDEAGAFDPVLTYTLVARRLAELPYAVIPGYYGGTSKNTIKVFSRGGSDISGAIIARAVNASLYENCTDVSGVLACDPRIVPEAHTIPQMTGLEVRELAYSGASVLHPDALLPVLEGNIPTRVLNTFDPTGASTLIQNCIEQRAERIVGVAARKGFFVISVAQTSMNSQIGFVRRLLEILERHSISLEHMPGSLDSVSLVIDRKYEKSISAVVEEMRTAFPSASVTLKPSRALVAVVGEGMANVTGILAGITASLADQGINVSTINQGENEMVILIGVAESNAEHAIRAIYRDCIDKR